MPTFSDAEKAAMQERAREQREFKKLSGEEQVSRKISEMNPNDKKIAQGIHDLVTSIDERLKPQTWYGMPAYYLDGKVVCFFQAGSKFDSRYSTFGFQESAQLDDARLDDAQWESVAVAIEPEEAAKEAQGSDLDPKIG
jgi:uncharacterized protein YdhG (YjbR/CyaY superfamily)